MPARTPKPPPKPTNPTTVLFTDLRTTLQDISKQFANLRRHELGTTVLPTNLDTVALTELSTFFRKIRNHLATLRETLMPYQGSWQAKFLLQKQKLEGLKATIAEPKNNKMLLRIEYGIGELRARLAGDMEVAEMWKRKVEETWVGEEKPVINVEKIKEAIANYGGIKAPFADEKEEEGGMLAGWLPRLNDNVATVMGALQEQLEQMEIDAAGGKVDDRAKWEVGLKACLGSKELMGLLKDLIELIQGVMMRQKEELDKAKEEVVHLEEQAALISAEVHRRKGRSGGGGGSGGNRRCG